MNITFDDLALGKRFKMGSNIVYKKTSIREATVIIGADGKTVTNGSVTVSFYKSKMIVTEVKQ